MDHSGISKSFKTRFLTGLFITFPLALTVISVIWLFELLDGILGSQLDKVLGVHIPGLGLFLSIIIVFAVGTLATTVFGQRFLNWVELFMLKAPVFRSFYSTFKQLGDAFSPHNKSAFKKFVIVEYPRHGSYSFGFLTKECMIRSHDGRDECYMTVYVPTNHVYLGDIALFKKDEVIVTDMSIEEGVRVVLSAGIAAPNVISKGVYYSPMQEAGEATDSHSHGDSVL